MNNIEILKNLVKSNQDPQEMRNREQLSKFLNIFGADKIVTPKDVQEVLKGVLQIMNSFKTDNIKLNKETTSIVEDLLSKILKEYNKIKDEVEEDKINTKNELSATLKKSISDMKGMCEELLLRKPKDGEPGKDADEEIIVSKVLEQIKLPEQKEVILDGGEEIVDKINALSLDDENKIDFSHIKNAPISKGVGGVMGIKEIVAGTGVTVDNSNLGYPVVSASSSVGAFTDLTDVPSAYTGQGGKVVAVKADVSGLEFITATSSDEKVKYDAGDPTAGYVADKIVAGTGISVAEGSGANENKLVVTNSSPDQTVAITAGTNITSVTGTYPNFTINAATQTTDISGKVDKSTFDANSILYATTDNTPVALTVGTNTVVGRVAGAITTLAVDSDLSSVSASDDTVPSAKATKAALDLKLNASAVPVKASGAELDTGTDNDKFATAKALKDSHNVPSVAPGTSGNVLTSNGTDWTSAAPSGGTSTYTFIMAGSCYSNGVFSYNAQGWNIFPAFALPDDSTKSFIGSTTTPAGKTGISAIRAYYIGAGVNAGNIVCEFSTGKIDPDTAGNTLTADNTTTATTITGTQNGIGFLDFPADSFNAMGTIAEPDIIGVRVDRIGGNGGDTYSSSIDMIGFRITWS